MSRSPHLSLQHREAIERYASVTVVSYDVALDLDVDDATFGSRTTIVFESTGAATFVDVKPVRLTEVRLNGVRLDPESWDRGRLTLHPQAGANELVVDAVMGFRSDGEGLHRSVDPADGRHYVYGMSFLDAAPSIFACFDQPDLKAPYTFHVRAPVEWTVIGNAPGTQVEPGVWELEQSQPLSTYFVTLVAGPWHAITTEHDGIRLGLTARRSIAGALERDAEEILTVTRQCFDEFHRLFDDRYPFGDYHQAFVPDFNAGAMENPGCVTLRDPYLFTSQVTRGAQCLRATTIAHELAHQWFGNLTTPTWWDDLWLNESFAEYMGNRVTADVTEFDDAWVRNAYQRRQWGLLADSGPTTHPVAGTGASDAVTALQDFDGISYTKGSSILKQLNARLGDDVFLAGVNDHFARHRFANATMHDLFNSWERAGAGDLGDVTQGWLRTSGVDRVTLDRHSGMLRRTPPTSSTTAALPRRHAFDIAAIAADGSWRREGVVLDDAASAVEVAPEEVVVLDAGETSWLVAQVDPASMERLAAVMPLLTDDALRASVWNNVRSSFETAVISPEDVLAVAVASIPGETNDEPLSLNARAIDPSKLLLTEWLITKVAPLSADPVAAVDALHAAYCTRLETAGSGSTVQHAAFRAAVETSSSTEDLERWLAGDLPAGISTDLSLRWLLLLRLACLGAVDRSSLDQHLAEETTAVSTVEHARAVASLPTPESKQWAWDRFVGAVDAPSYELQACGQGMWRPGQEALTESYVERFFDELPHTASVRSGWLLASAACWFFPLTSLTDETVARAEELARAESLDSSLRRQLAIMADEVRRRIAVRSEA
ncbi:aminopeptidase N [Nocardioides sp. CF8]|uniref:aminopeptidase N n=1 Tax=Nocardioides sp. CF8 TaxID=110319 RepID=UPI00032DBACE|nr:aminopeptidase N [Nocardioides sp. CF8]EON24015.1 aminopeptidase N [Nocardioides sp. CF8]